MKKITILVLLCLMSINSQAQVYAYDSSLKMPTRDLYDTEVMNMTLRAYAETAARRSAYFKQYSRMAAEAYNEENWYDAIKYANSALSLFENGQQYYIRGYGYESLGYLKEAKKDYKRAKKLGYYDAVQALESLNEKIKAQKKK